MPKTEIKVRLVVTDFKGDPADVSAILGLTPSKTWRKGDPVHPKAKNTHKQNGWLLEGKRGKAEGLLEGQVDALLASVSATAPRFSELPKGAEVQLSCIVYANGERPALSLSAASIRTLADLRANVDIDFYELSQD